MKIELKHVTKKFPNRNRKIKEFVTAVEDMTFEIPDGALVCIIGPSGCGKSTALNLISGLEMPTDGYVLFDGEDVTNVPPEKRGIGMVFQSYALYPHLNVRKNISFPLENLKGADKLTKDQIKEKVNEVARIVQIDELMDRKPGQMSGGQQQRVAIARALVKKPKVLLLDEPLSNLDARLRIQTREEIRRIQRETGITTVFVTHDQEEAMSISDLIILIKKGVVYQIGKPQELYDNPANLFSAKFLGNPPINVLGGEVKDGFLYVGTDKALPLKLKDYGNRRVFVGIRPEGLFLSDDLRDEDCGIRAVMKSVETLGRDTSVIAKHHAMSDGADLRAIISSDHIKEIPESGRVCFTININKIFLFDRETEERLDFEYLGVDENFASAIRKAAAEKEAAETAEANEAEPSVEKKEETSSEPEKKPKRSKGKKGKNHDQK